ncbi:AI-2E family transporter [Cyanothece sp. BG0011]|uniref:AI-2E family transporter n=1 Tax=Cyanothece sp. BG0011 TaxID=2082950 RepID=UPI000D1DD466|nr:AI-2E family transporter [Cyanothece sp. BG0011]
MGNRFNFIEIVDLLIRLFLIGLLIFWCFLLIRPFLGILLWGIILAIAIFPVFLWLKNRLGGRRKLAGVLLILLGIAVIVGPVSFVATIFVGNAQTFADNIASGSLKVPPPPEGVEKWPILGNYIDQLWTSASNNLVSALSKFQPQLEGLAKNLLFFAGNMGLVLLKFILSIIVAGILTINSKQLNRRIKRVFIRITPQQGEAFLQLATATIRGVTRGIIGVSLIQSLLVGIGLMLAGMPLSGLLTVLSLVLCILQIGLGPVVFPSIIFAWYTMGTLKALLLTIWLIFCTLIDNILKPIFMSQGVSVPILIIFIGVLGGSLLHGILGLFIGPVVLSLGYELLLAWVKQDIKPILNNGKSNNSNE